MLTYYMLAFALILAISPLARHQALASVQETYIEWDYIICLEDIMLREYTRQDYVPYNEEVLEYACIEKLLYPRAQKPVLTASQQTWLNQLFEKTRTDIIQAGTQSVRVRKEYRVMTVAERTAFNNAVNELKRDSGKYDALASLHVGSTAGSAHRGPASFPWHRIYLLLFENALREYNPSVVLPYWDSTLDEPLEDPKSSILWTNAFLGNGDGLVTSGPFAGWTNDGVSLIRNIQESGRLLKATDIENVLSNRRLGEISFPNAELEDNLELHMFGVQLWVGGDMARLSTAANDPVYFLLHAHADCVWEKFRENQTDPLTDWPWRYEGNANHAVNAFLGLIENYRSADVLAVDFTDLYRCEEIPACSRNSDCLSPSLRCDVGTGMCVTATAASRLGEEESCAGTVGYQNNYCLGDGNDCNVANWVYLPIEIVYNRPPDFGTYNSLPLLSPTWVFNHDIYSPMRFNRSDYYRVVMRQRPSNPVYKDCKCRESEHGRVYIQSYGLSYQGSYREYVPVDRRLPVSSVVGYVGVKAPVGGPSRVMVRVYDDCGRVCTAVCPPEYTNCSGVMQLDQTVPLGYGEDLENALYITWDFESSVPKPKDNFDLKFYCTFNADWPFGAMGYIPDPNEEKPVRTDGPGERPLTTTTTTIRTTPTTTTTTTTPTTTVLIEPDTCFISVECYGGYEPTGCIRCNMGDYSPCPDRKEQFRQCGLGNVWQIHTCPAGLVWDQQVSVCAYNYWIELRKLFPGFNFGG